MREKRIFLLICMLGMVLSRGWALDLKLTSTDINQMDYAYDEATGVYTLTTTGYDPFVYVEALSEKAASNETTLQFEYQCEQGVEYFQIFFGNTISMTRVHYYDAIEPSTDWNTYSVNIKSQRSQFSWGSKGQNMRWDLGETAGVTIKIRNIRLVNATAPFKAVTVKPMAETVIQAEDYNVGGPGDAYNARQYPDVKIPAYENPTPGKLPIVAWHSFNDDQLTPERAQTMVDCGINLSYSRFGNEGRVINDALEACKGKDLKLILYSTLLDGYNRQYTTELVNLFKNHESLAAWYLGDEPLAYKFKPYGEVGRMIKAADPDHMLYLNLHNCSADVNALGVNTYVDYLQRSLREVGTSFLSFDMYPIIVQSGDTVVKPNFYQNLELVNSVCKQYGVPFWGFANAVGHSNVVPFNINYPAPTRTHLRYQIFTNLAYGAQGIEYYTYTLPYEENWNYHDGPLDANHNPTKVWYLLQDLNREVQNLAWVFLGAELVDASHVGGSLPTGTKRLTLSVLPNEFRNVACTGDGVLVTQLQNGSNHFLMIVNHSIKNSQRVTVDIRDGAVVNRVQADGMTVSAPTGSEKVTVAAGDYVLYQWSDEEESPAESLRAPQLRPTAEEEAAEEAATYRSDTKGVALVENSAFDGGYGLEGMGDDRWQHYSLGLYRSSTTRAITVDQAIENWGSWYNYTFDVEEDMDVEISIRHRVPLSPYLEMATFGVLPGNEYEIYRNTALNWPRRYAAAMILSLDGRTLKTNQTARPYVAYAEQTDPVAYGQTLANTDQWVSTLVSEAANDTLWFWAADADGGVEEPVYNDTPDYVMVHLTAGTHTLTVKSLCGGWDFDCLRITDSRLTGLRAARAGEGLKAIGGRGKITVNAGQPAEVFTASGVRVASLTKGTVQVPAGAYIVKQGAVSQKVLVK